VRRSLYGLPAIESAAVLYLHEMKLQSSLSDTDASPSTTRPLRYMHACRHIQVVS
jgi:hypothetical protein